MGATNALPLPTQPLLKQVTLVHELSKTRASSTQPALIKKIALRAKPHPQIVAPISSSTISSHSTSTPSIQLPVTQVRVLPSTTPPIANSAPTDFISQIEQFVHQEINSERAQNGLQALLWDGQLAAVARAHSLDMATHNYFAHDDQSGCSSACRISDTGYEWQTVGENIYIESGYEYSAKEAADATVSAWMQSSGHRANILNGSFTNEGIGVAQIGNAVYVTEDFAKPR